MIKIILIALLPLFALFGDNSDNLLAGQTQNGREGDTGTLEKMIVDTGSVSIDLNLGQLSGNRRGAKDFGPTSLRFDLQHDSFFTILVFNGELRGPVPSAAELIPQNSAAIPAKLHASYNQLVVESLPWGGQYELAVRDAKTGFVFFNIEGHEYGYDESQHLLTIQNGGLLISKEFAVELGRPSIAGSVVGNFSVSATMRAIEITKVFDGEVTSDVLPANGNPESGSVPGPDVMVGDVSGLTQIGASSGTQVGLALGTDSCNFGTVDLDWFQLPSNDHPVIPQNLYRMSGGTTNTDRFEQIGQSSLKHAFTALTNNICGLNCNGTGGTHLGSGCSDPYNAGLNGTQSGLGSRAWVNPFTGSYPRGDSGATNPNSHVGHSHTGTSHRIVTEIADLNTALNSGATYYAEGQYVTPHEYVWCQANPTQCNMNNNVSYRQYSVTGTTCSSGSSNCYSFPAGSFTTQRGKAAISAWTGATSVQVQPDPANDGIGFVAYKVTNPSPGVWHYEYAVYNQNLDRAIQSFSLPVGVGGTLSNIGFHAPPQQPGWTFDGTVGNTGYSSTPWASVQASGAITWSSETFAQNQNANAIRWGTLYNFRFDTNRPPQLANATVGFFKTGAPITVQVQVPTSMVTVSGYVRTSAGLGVTNARVSLRDPLGNVRTVSTNRAGNYQFDNVAAGGSFTISVTHKRYTFTSQSMPITDNVTGLNFLPN